MNKCENGEDRFDELSVPVWDDIILRGVFWLCLSGWLVFLSGLDAPKGVRFVMFVSAIPLLAVGLMRLQVLWEALSLLLQIIVALLSTLAPVLLWASLIGMVL